jgi:acyl-CoA dehydrogenase
LEYTVLARQIFGGHGCIAEHGMEPLVRDARIAMLSEGASGVQARDLVGRKPTQDDGQAPQVFMSEVQDYIQRRRRNRVSARWRLRSVICSGRRGGLSAMRPRRPTMPRPRLPTICTSWDSSCWAICGAESPMPRSAKFALDAAAKRMRGKLDTGRLFVERMFPETLSHLARIRLGAANLME